MEPLEVAQMRTFYRVFLAVLLLPWAAGAGALAAMAITFGCGAEEPDASAPISLAAVDRVEEEIAEWGTGRWRSWDLSIKENDLLIKIWVDSSANDVALATYCRVLGKIVRSNLGSGATWKAQLIQGGRAARECP